jgi:hypothetical protein
MQAGALRDRVILKRREMTGRGTALQESYAAYAEIYCNWKVIGSAELSRTQLTADGGVQSNSFAVMTVRDVPINSACTVEKDGREWRVIGEAKPLAQLGFMEVRLQRTDKA